MSFGASFKTGPSFGLGVGRPRPGRMPVIFNDFAGYGFSDRVTFARDSEVNGFVDGPVLNTFAIDEPAFVIDPATGQSLGYRELQGFTNSLLWSRDLSNAVWTKGGDITVAQDAVGLKGVANTAHTITDNDGAQIGFVNQDRTIASTDTASELIYIGKNGSPGGYPRVGLVFPGATAGNTLIVLDRSDGSFVMEAGSSSDVTVRDAGDFWECEFYSGNSGGGTTLRFNINPAWNADGTTASDASATGSIVYDFGGVYLNSSIAGPPIETEGTTVSTAADDATEPLPASCQNGFVWVVHARTASGFPDQIIRLGAISDGSNDNRVLINRDESGNIKVAVVSDGAIVINDVITSVPNDTDFKIAARFSGGSYAIAVDGSVMATDTSTEFPVGLSQKDIGQDLGGGLEWNSTIALDYLDPDPSAWTDADLQNASAL